MKHLFIIYITIALVLIMGCQRAVDIAAEKAAIKAILDSYILSVEKEDIELYSKILINDSDMVNFGTNVSQRIVGWDALRKAIEEQNAALSETAITQSDVTINVSPNGKFAWATSLWDFKSTMEAQVIQLPVRCSWILEKKGDDWKIVHFHKSVGTT